MHESLSFSITTARTRADLDAIIDLFRAYSASLDVDLAYQDFEAELAAMPGKYATPTGELLLARGADGKAVGCAALRPLDLQGCCEMKRLYVSPEGRGSGLGRQLIDAVVKSATRVGYSEMRLDTLPTMAGAQALYRKLGFEVIEPYYHTPIVGTLFMRRFLRPR